MPEQKKIVLLVESCFTISKTLFLLLTVLMGEFKNCFYHWRIFLLKRKTKIYQFLPLTLLINFIFACLLTSSTGGFISFDISQVFKILISLFGGEDTQKWMNFFFLWYNFIYNLVFSQSVYLLILQIDKNFYLLKWARLRCRQAKIFVVIPDFLC
mgnify:CR=1 FL=1